MFIVLFKVKNISFAIKAEFIQEITRMIKMDFFPTEQGIIDSVINYRGNSIPIMDTLKYLKKQRSSYDKESIIVIISAKNNLVGLLADDVLQTMEIASSNIQDFSTIESEYFNTFVKVKNEILPILNINRLIKDISKDTNKLKAEIK